MKCSDCHAQIKPVVAIDIDGTLGNYHEHLIHFMEQYLDTKFPRSTYPYTGDHSFREWFGFYGVSAETYRSAKLAYRQGGWKRTMPTFGNTMINDLRHLRESMGFELWIATTRPYLRLDNVDPDTREWLRRNCVPYDGVLYGEDKYAMLVECVGSDRIAFVLDDLPEQYDAAEDLELPVWQIVRQHNSAQVAQRPRRVYASKVYSTILDEVNKWKSEHTTQVGQMTLL